VLAHTPPAMQKRRAMINEFPAAPPAAGKLTLSASIYGTRSRKHKIHVDATNM
jgi:hypothetical protein